MKINHSFQINSLLKMICVFNFLPPHNSSPRNGGGGGGGTIPPPPPPFKLNGRSLKVIPTDILRSTSRFG